MALLSREMMQVGERLRFTIEFVPFGSQRAARRFEHRSVKGFDRLEAPLINHQRTFAQDLRRLNHAEVRVEHQRACHVLAEQLHAPRGGILAAKCRPAEIEHIDVQSVDRQPIP